jgi:hypothetical protein
VTIKYSILAIKVNKNFFVEVKSPCEEFCYVGEKCVSRASIFSVTNFNFRFQ